MTADPWMRRLFIAGGYVAAAGIGAGLTALRYSRMDPAVVYQSGGMVAFGHLVYFLSIAGTLSLPPSFFLFRELRAFGWFWKICAGCGLVTALSAVLSEAGLAIAFLGEGLKFNYSDPAFFNLSWLAWLYYNAHLGIRFWVSPAIFALLLCVYFAAPRCLARRLIAWAAVIESAVLMTQAFSVWLLLRYHQFHA